MTGADLARRHVLLLQGPVGPFFAQLQRALESQGARVTRVLFNAGDILFAPDHGTERFSGSRAAWIEWLETRIVEDRPDAIVLFGCKRPAHLVARDAAERHGIPLHSLEEGYLRSGFVTCERGGNNNQSPIRGSLPAPGEKTEHPSAVSIAPNFRIMSWWGFLYYAARILFSRRDDEKLYHRSLGGPFREAAFWLRNAMRLVSTKRSEATALRALYRDFDRDYFLVPLQMPSDSQMGAAANGWSIERLIEGAIAGFAATRSKARLVFKLHPLDGEAGRRARLIRDTARRHGVDDEVLVFHSGSMATMTQHSDGMIIVNSTSGFSALHHGVPLLVLGDAVFRNEALASCGDDERAIERFMTERFVAEEDLRRHYLEYLAAHALVPGDFYDRNAMKVAAENVAQTVLDDCLN